ncbi:type II toxin-antitoxin system death-on-curing family toxin [Methanothrix sp.]|uniref:type II toxin-antitoxin system death-on-curing family toxin n=1 Tax=Methanothrix sp. TaxID=90426 RepID=UPI003C7425A7
MINLTVEMVKKIHDYLIETEGGESGVRDIGTLEYLVNNINCEEDLFRKAAWALMLADWHPFWDGQKRTALQLADLILRDGGYHIHAEDEELIQVLTIIAEYKCNLKKILRWVQKKARKLEGRRQLHLG